MSSGSNPALRAAVVGYGSYGRKHARKYLEHPDATLTAVVDTDPARRRQVAAELPGVAVLDEPAGLERLADVASVVSPASTHHAIARTLLEHDIHLLVEKPFATSPQQAAELLAAARVHACVLQPGHVERFDMTLAALAARLPRPRYIEARRFTRWRDRGGDTDVIFDLMIHDIDRVLALVAAPVRDVRAHGIRVFSQHWDVCHAELHFDDGCIANLTASRASPEPERRLHVFAADACMFADAGRESIVLHERDPACARVVMREQAWRHADSLAAEIDGFLQAVRHHAPPRVSGEDGRRAVEIAARIVAAIEHDGALCDRISAPMTDSTQALDWLQRGRLQ